jgi:succinyl-CoA synthetase beta subunit
MDIEEVAEHTPHLIFTEEIDPVDFKVFKQEQLL